MADQHAKAETVEDVTAEGGARQASVQWDDSQLQTNFANVVNIQSNREQVDLYFGTNQTWNIASDHQVRVELTNRIILTPFAAKRLMKALSGVIQEYESRHGPLGGEN